MTHPTRLRLATPRLATPLACALALGACQAIAEPTAGGDARMQPADDLLFVDAARIDAARIDAAVGPVDTPDSAPALPDLGPPPAVPDLATADLAAPEDPGHCVTRADCPEYVVYLEPVSGPQDCYCPMCPRTDISLNRKEHDLYEAQWKLHCNPYTKWRQFPCQIPSCAPYKSIACQGGYCLEAE